MLKTTANFAHDTPLDAEGASHDAVATGDLTADRYAGRLEEAVERTVNDLDAEATVLPRGQPRAP